MTKEQKIKLWEYANSFMYRHIKSDDQLNNFIKGSTKFTDEEKVLLKQYWELIVYGETEDNVVFDEEQEDTIVDLKEEQEE